jgi:hypothetical protein
MVALLRTLGAPPLWCNGIARHWLAVAQKLVTRGHSLAREWVWGEWKQLGSLVWRPCVAPGNDRE